MVLGVVLVVLEVVLVVLEAVLQLLLLQLLLLQLLLLQLLLLQLLLLQLLLGEQRKLTLSFAGGCNRLLSGASCFILCAYHVVARCYAVSCQELLWIRCRASSCSFRTVLMRFQ